MHIIIELCSGDWHFTKLVKLAPMQANAGYNLLIYKYQEFIRKSTQLQLKP